VAVRMNSIIARAGGFVSPCPLVMVMYSTRAVAIPVGELCRPLEKKSTVPVLYWCCSVTAVWFKHTHICPCMC